MGGCAIRYSAESFGEGEGLVAGGRVYGYRNERVARGKTIRVIHEPEAAVVRRIFADTARGVGMKSLAHALNAERVPGPRFACPPLRLQPDHEHGDECPRHAWAATGVREVLRRELYRGVDVYGRITRVKKRGTTVRAKTDRSKWITRQDDALRIVTDDLWHAAQAQIQANRVACATTREDFRNPDPGARRGKFLLSGFLVCGADAVSPRAHGGAICGDPLTILQRGPKLQRVYVCSGHRQKGSAYCRNTTAVPMRELHAAVIAALRRTFTPRRWTRTSRNRHQTRPSAPSASVNEPRCSPASRCSTRRRRGWPTRSLPATGASTSCSRGSRPGRTSVSVPRRAWASWRRSSENYEQTAMRSSDSGSSSRRGSRPLDNDPEYARTTLRSLLDAPIAVKPLRRGAWGFAGIGRVDIVAGTVGKNAGPDWIPLLADVLRRSKLEFVAPSDGGDAPTAAEVADSLMEQHQPYLRGGDDFDDDDPDDDPDGSAGDSARRPGPAPISGESEPRSTASVSPKAPCPHLALRARRHPHATPTRRPHT